MMFTNSVSTVKIALKYGMGDQEVSTDVSNLEQISIQPFIDKLCGSVLKDKKVLQKFAESNDLWAQVEAVINCQSHRPNVTVRAAVDEIIEGFSNHGELSEGKSEEKASHFKEMGTKCKYGDAVKLYTTALLLCPRTSSNLPLLYANRSAALYHMCHYQECLTDIDLSSTSGYPESLLHKIMLRKAQCLLALKENKEAANVAKVAQSLIFLLKPSKQKETYLSVITSLIQNINICEVTHQLSTTSTEGLQNVPIKNSDPSLYQPSLSKQRNDDWKENSVSFDELNLRIKDNKLLDSVNSSVNFMSGALEMRENKKEGRHIISKKCIPKGAAVFVEKPFASILLPQYLGTFCYNCITCLGISPIPCTGCRVVQFCSVHCRSAAHWHLLDCRCLTLATGSGMAHLALRIIASAGWSVCRTVMSEDDRLKNEQYNKWSPVCRYRAVYGLVHHLQDIQVEERLQYCMAAIILATMAKNKVTSEFSLHIADEVTQRCATNSSPNTKNWEIELTVPVTNKTLQENVTSAGELHRHKEAGTALLYGSLTEVSALLYRHIAQLVCNGYAIYHVMAQSSGGLIESVRQERVATAVYATASLMNHSCQPSTINSYIGDWLVVHTIEDLKPGQQVYSCYGPHFTRHSRTERQDVLRHQYRFSCSCRACTRDDYLMKEAQWCGMKCELCGGLASFIDSSASHSKATASGIALSKHKQLPEPTTETLKCFDCGKMSPPSKEFAFQCLRAQQLYEAGEASLTGGSTMQAIQELEAAANAGAQVYSQGNEFLACILDMQAMALATAGRFCESASVLKRCLGITKRRYGEKSVEVGHELIKYAKVLQQELKSLTVIESKNRLEQLTEVEKEMDDIFTTCYGDSWKSVLNVNL